MYTDMTTRRPSSELREILDYLVAHDVPLVHAAHLLCSLTGINFKRVADTADIGRGHLYMMLRGMRPVSESARQAFVGQIGIDPWSPSP